MHCQHKVLQNWRSLDKDYWNLSLVFWKSFRACNPDVKFQRNPLSFIKCKPRWIIHLWKYSLFKPNSLRMEKKNLNSPKLDIFELIFLINLMLFGCQRRLEWCMDVTVLFKPQLRFSYFSCWNRQSKGHFPDDMVGRIEFWLRSS